MSFGSGGFGGFGQSNTQQPSGFGGFGAASNTNPGFGSSNPGGFGSNTNPNPNPAGGGLFGNTTANTATGFGASPGGFGSNTGGSFGNKTSFGSTATGGGGLFGANTNQTTSGGFGGFGGTNTTQTSSPFGGGTTTGGSGLFGASNANKTGFGSTSNTSSSLFGGTTATGGSGGFGSTGGFGASNNAGLGGSVGDPPGTAVSPFQAFTEKEPNSTATNSFQSIMFQDPYKKWSAEELRLADYAQGRRHGNASGAGAFGVSSGFGGGSFGSNTQQTTSGFGANQNTPSGGLFGSNTTNTNTASPGFGGGSFGTNTAANTNTTGGGLFGANKPAGGLFGSTNTPQQAGGLFGSSGGGFGQNTGSSFGQSNTAGGGLFGSAQNQQKPAGTGFSFGNTAAPATSTGFGSQPAANTFGSNPNTGGSGLFGSNTASNNTGGMFGGSNNQQQQNTSTGFGGSFGQQNQNQPQQTGSSLFGNTQAKPAGTGMFGNAPGNTTATPGGLFANNQQPQQQPQGGGLFGSNTAQSGGGLFGNKPAAGGGLFGNNPAQNTTGSLFGSSNQTQQQPAAGGLFGSTNNQVQKPGGLFGASASQPTGGSLFGSQPNQNQGGSLFGASTNQQQQQGSALGSSFFNQQQPVSNQAPSLTASLSDVSAYGNASLFAGVGGAETPNPGPLATPLNNNSKPRRSSILPMYKLAPASASRYATPQKRGFGFSYSSYGTPVGSPASSISSTPGTLGRSLLGSSANGNLSKSVSVNNLRRSFNTEDSILAPGAFSASSSRWYGSTGSKKLIINRDLRSDLFSTPQKDRHAVDSNSSSRKLSKRVSFDTSNVDSDDGTPVRGALPAPEEPNGTPSDETPRQTRSQGSSQPHSPAENQVNGRELARVNEDELSATPEANATSETEPGEYYMQPSLDELQSMNRIQRQTVADFTVGRDNIGKITFKVPVDLSNVDFDDLQGKTIKLEPRSATVYPDQNTKPPIGKGLNVPARITLEQSWPRNARERNSKRLEKHIERLKRIPDTTFESYNKDNGVWVFSVEHFTTYGLDESDDETEGELDAPAPEVNMDVTGSQQMMLDAPGSSLMEDDTFNMGKRQGLPGTFDQQEAMYEDDVTGKQSFLGVSSANSAPNDVRLSLEQEHADEMSEEYDVSEDEDVARSSTGQHLVAEREENSSEGGQEMKKGTPGGILRARMRAMKDSAGPIKLEVADGDDWMEMLRKTVSPVKRDRLYLKEMNESAKEGVLIDLDKSEDDNTRTSLWKRNTAKPDRGDGFPTTQMHMDKGRGFATSIDLMNSLFEKPRAQNQGLRASISSKGFPKWPYERQDKTPAIDETEQAFHDASRPTWGPNETLVLTRDLSSTYARQTLRNAPGILAFQKSSIQTDRQDLRLAQFSTQSSKKFLRNQDQFTHIHLVDDVPMAKLQVTSIKDIFRNENMNDPAAAHEKRIWELASILFDSENPAAFAEPDHAARKAKLSRFWADLVDHSSATAIGLASSSEEKAVACLAGHRVTEACKHLADGRNFRLGTLVALIGTSDVARKDMKEQVKAWHDSKMLSEFSEPIRTIYELLSGNVCVCEGLKNVPVQDRLESFVISQKFGLDWRQAFGLRLWYAISKNEDLAAAVDMFKDDIAQDREKAPQPWYAEQGITPLWDDESLATRQDLLWGLLQLYADEDADLEAILRPENSQLSPLDMRLCWQLGLALVSTGKVSYGQGQKEKADSATLAYAAQLSSGGEWLEAIFVLLHLSDSTARMKAIQEQLCQHAGSVGSESSTTFGVLTEKFRIPAPWLWEALALYMRSVKKDASAEVHCLFRAGSFVEAHRVLVQQVAPQAVIERDYVKLSSLMSHFEGRQEFVSEWSLGGEIYSYFLTLVHNRMKGEATSATVLERLLSGLHAMNEVASDTDLTQYAAISDMADETAKEILRMSKKKQDTELRARILSLPLTQDRLLAYSVDLGLDRYREVMSH